MIPVMLTLACMDPTWRVMNLPHTQVHDQKSSAVGRRAAESPRPV